MTAPGDVLATSLTSNVAGGGHHPTVARLSDTLEAMGCVGISPSHRGQLLRILSGLLHLGNVNLASRRDVPEGCVVAEGSASTALSRACKLLKTAPAAAPPRWWRSG